MTEDDYVHATNLQRARNSLECFRYILIFGDEKLATEYRLLFGDLNDFVEKLQRRVKIK